MDGNTNSQSENNLIKIPNSPLKDYIAICPNHDRLGTTRVIYPKKILYMYL